MVAAYSGGIDGARPGHLGEPAGDEWIDVTHLAVGLIKSRLHDRYQEEVQYIVKGEPEAEPDARVLAKADPFQFQVWALGRSKVPDRRK